MRRCWRSAPALTSQRCSVRSRIGRWTATVVLLRGLGRLDVFPLDDSSVARNFKLVAAALPFDAAVTLEALGAQRGMLYYHLLLARLEASGEIGSPSGQIASGSGDLCSSRSSVEDLWWTWPP